MHVRPADRGARHHGALFLMQDIYSYAMGTALSAALLRRGPPARGGSSRWDLVRTPDSGGTMGRSSSCTKADMLTTGVMVSHKRVHRLPGTQPAKMPCQMHVCNSLVPGISLSCPRRPQCCGVA